MEATGGEGPNLSSPGEPRPEGPQVWGHVSKRAGENRGEVCVCVCVVGASPQVINFSFSLNNRVCEWSATLDW